MVLAFEDTGLFQAHQITRLFDDAQSRCVAIRVVANQTRFGFRQIETRVAVPHILANSSDGVRQSQRFGFGDTQNVKRQSFGALAADPWKAA